jgi:hypothetical protein
VRYLVPLLLAACGQPASSQPDAAVPADASVCVPLDTCDWLTSYQQRIVAALSGEADITPGMRIAHRATFAERDTARQYLIDELAALGYSAQRHDYVSGMRVGANVITTLDATGGTGGMLIVGAHFDSVAVAPGAADNATGCAIVLAAARYLRDVEVRNHPVTFALFDQEEIGLVGSRAWAPTLAPASITSVHVFDMLSFDGDGDQAVELWSPAPAIQAIYEQHGALAQMPIQPVSFALSDHQAFIELGIPATGVGEEFVAMDHTPDYHKSTDTYDKVSFTHLANVTHLALSVLEAEVRAP